MIFFWKFLHSTWKYINCGGAGKLYECWRNACKGRVKKKKRKIVEFPSERLSGKKNWKMIYSPWNECCMIWALWHLSDGFSTGLYRFDIPFGPGSKLRRRMVPPQEIEEKKIRMWKIRPRCYPPSIVENSTIYLFIFFNPSLKGIATNIRGW